MSKKDSIQDLNMISSPQTLSLQDSNNSTNTTSSQTSSRPVEQKRRRVTRACDNCRQKKVKCDGKQPCIHCTVYSYNCTYDQPNIRNKKNTGIPVPSYPQSHPAINAILSSGGSPLPFNPVARTLSNNLNPKQSSNLMLSQKILNLLLPKLKLNVIDDKPQNFDFDKLLKVVNYLQAKSPGQVLLNEISDLYQDGPQPMQSPSGHHERQSSVCSDDNSVGREIKIILPPKDVALQLIYTTWYKACVLFRFYHRPSLLEEVELLYSLDPLNYTDRQQKFLPFLYSILACGLLFSKLAHDPSNNESLNDDGFMYFLEARKLIDITNVGDIHSIQTIVMMIMYLQCSARLSTCYSYIGIALRSALKEGLHRNLSIFQSSKRKLDPIEVDTRKRLFFTIYKMDIYINSLLGLPRSINEDEFDQELPEDLDDENVTRDSYLYENQGGRLSSSGCANYHTKLMMIISHIVKELYPIKVKNASQEHMTPGHIHRKVTDIELELKHWLEKLPAELKPTDPNNSNSDKEIPEKFLLANYYLHLAFLNCQIMLYRPFIHFISNGTNIPISDPRSLIRGRNCIKVARMVVKLADKMIDKDLLVGTYWFSMYTIFFSIACLIYYFHFANYNNIKGVSANGVNYAGVLFDDDLNIDMIKKDIEVGKKLLDCLKNSSHSSLRIYNILNNLFEQLNRRTATTSRSKGNPLINQSTFEANDESVKSTFRNFDKMNDFNRSLARSQSQVQPAPSNDASPILRSASAQGGDGISLGIDRKRGAPIKDEAKDDTSLRDFFLRSNMHDNMVNTIPDDNTDKESMYPDMSSSNSLENASVDYLPGVIDTLDAQIFGRILPPYMLEKNVKLFEENGGQKPSSLPESVQNYNVPNNLPQSEGQGQNVGVQGMRFDDFDLMGMNDNYSLEYLDPFNVGEAPDFNNRVSAQDESR